MAIMPILALFRENKKIQLQNATLVSIEPLVTGPLIPGPTCSSLH